MSEKRSDHDDRHHQHDADEAKPDGKWWRFHPIVGVTNLRHFVVTAEDVSRMAAMSVVPWVPAVRPRCIRPLAF
jgi:hypothetical protein